MQIKKKKGLQGANKVPSSDFGTVMTGSLGGSVPSASTATAIAKMKSLKKGVSEAQVERSAKGDEPAGGKDAPGFMQKEGGEWRKKYLERMKKKGK